MPESCAERRQNLIIEYNWLLAWAKEAELMEEKSQDSISRSLGAPQLEIAAVLSAIRTVLETIAELYGRYEELRPDSVGEQSKPEQDGTLRSSISEVSTMVLAYNEKKKARISRTPSWNSASKVVAGVGAVLKYPKRIRWVLVDEAAFDAALKRLHGLNNHLREFSGETRLKAIQKTVEMTFMELVQSMETQKELLAMVRAVVSLLAEPQVNRPQGDINARNELQTLRDLAKLKELNIASEMSDPMPSNRIQYTEDEGSKTITIATYLDYPEETETPTTVLPSANTKRVWIEWKKYGLRDFKKSSDDHEEQAEAAHREITSRTARLAELLACSKPTDFCTPSCLGYLDEPNNCRLGWVFAMPVETTHPPRSLRSLLSKIACPSLTERVALASRLTACLLYLHAVNWLHKALRSDNILFIYDGDIPPISEPIVSGFDLSRPDEDSAKTIEMADANPRRDMYRWPMNQTSLRDENRARKTFDIYSLGIILLEIAHWKPIESIMGFPDVDSITTSQSLKIRSRLLDTEPQPLAKLLQIMGRKYHDAVKACIKGPEGFGLADRDNQTDPTVGVALQRMYMERVVQKLKSLDI
ncbi:prion-inhibition and propagation domain-containing protein [Trichoderma sp. SZMC 28012]